MDKKIDKLISCLWIEYIFAWGLALLLIALYEFGIISEGLYAGNAKMEYILQTIGILLAMGLIPTSLRMFHLSIVKYIKEEPLNDALISYRHWSEVRLGLLIVASLINLSVYYTTMNSTGALCAAMALVASLFCVPNKEKILKQLDLIKED